jgi:hypothetical protein
MNEQINHPKHYNINWKGEQAIETFDYINSWRMGYAQGNIIKYVSRYKYKGKDLQDLKKARWYLEKLINEVENENRQSNKA